MHTASQYSVDTSYKFFDRSLLVGASFKFVSMDAFQVDLKCFLLCTAAMQPGRNLVSRKKYSALNMHFDLRLCHVHS